MSEAAPAPGPNQGQPIPRVDARAKVMGQARYAADVPVANVAYGYLVTSEIARGTITGMDTAAAEAVPGVRLVMTHRNRPKLTAPKPFAMGGTSLTASAPLAGPRISHHGQIVALVVADSFEAAREAAHRMTVRYRREEPSSTFGSPGTKTELTSVAAKRPDPKLGDIAKGFAAAAVTHEAEYATPTQHHNAIELHATTAVWNGDELTLYEPSQWLYGLKNGIAQQLGIEPDKVRVRNDFLGGAFGGKAAVGSRTALVALAARQLSRPVKLVLTRDQCFVEPGHRQETRHRISIGAAKDGRITAYKHDLDELTARDDTFVNTGVENAAAMYNFPAVASTARIVRADRHAPCFMRSPPEFPCMYALESAMDEMAGKLGMDPIEFRRVNDTKKNNVTGAPYSSRGLMECYDAGAAAFGWAKRNPEPGSMRRGEWLVGYGCATATYPTSTTSAVARVRYGQDGRAEVHIAAHDLGQGAYTAYTNICAEQLGIDPDNVTVRMGDSRLPPGPIMGGSVGTASGGSAIKLACDKIKARLAIDARASASQRRAAFGRAGAAVLEEQGDYVPEGAKTKTTEGAYKATPEFVGGTTGAKTMFAFGAEFVEVHVHARTREVRVPRITGAFAAGRIVNPRTARSQLMGGMIWGIGSALHEFTEIDKREARYVNDNLAEYLLAVNADIRDVDVIFVPEEDAEANPVGVKGIGELGNVGTAAAVANAVYHATGKRIRELPITVDKLIV